MEQIRCRACRSFRHDHQGERECTGCGRTLRVKDGYCRLCWVQLSGGRAWEGTTPPAVAALTAAGVKITHHQLFFDKMSPRKGAGPRPAARAGAGKAPLPGRAQVQPDLLARPARPRRIPDAASPALAAAVRVADSLAEARGWSAEIRRRVRKGLGIALAGCGEGEDVQWSRALPLLRAAGQAGRADCVLRDRQLVRCRHCIYDLWPAVSWISWRSLCRLLVLIDQPPRTL